MDWLIFWVTVGFLVEGTRLALRKWCIPLPEKEPSLVQPLLDSADCLASSGKCRLQCCAHKSGSGLLEETVEQLAEEHVQAELAGKVDRDLFVPPVLKLSEVDNEKWRNANGKEDLEGRKVVGSLHRRQDDRNVRRDLVKSEIVHSAVPKIRRESWAKVYPEPPGPQAQISLQHSENQFMFSGKCSFDSGQFTIPKHCSGNYNLSTDYKVPNFPSVSS